jgi:hypothetical protein
MKTITIILATLGLALAASGSAHAQSSEDYDYQWHETHLPSGFGVATVLGGGVSGFTESQVRRLTSNVQGLWNLRVTLGSHDTFALDFDYVGTAGYIFGGAGYQHYHVTGMSPAAVAGILHDSDTFAVFPLGLGFAYRERGLVIDVRGTLRLAADSNLIASSTTTGGFASMHTWEASAGAGYEF